MSLTNEFSASTALGRYLPDRVFSRSGARLDPHSDVWTWTDGPFKRRIDFTRYSGGYERHVLSLKHALIPFFKSSSSAHVVNLETAFRYFVDLTGPCPAGDFTAANLSNFAAKLGHAEAWRIGTLNGLIQKWVALNLPGMLSECATYLAEQRKPGNKKGEAVTTRNPVTGPLSEVEVTALYSAVNAAYGRGDLPLWSLILCRLLLACGGRISQLASLKIFDFNPETLVLRLPQAKTREKHARSRLLDFDISPQTSSLIADYLMGLKNQGYSDDAPFFPEELVMRRVPLEQLRTPDDLFYGHCEPNTLSRRFREEVGEVAPPTPRLDFAQLPVAPQRFRYTFGTRLAEEGASQLVIANRLGHADLQNVDVYFSASPKVVENIDKAMGPLLVPLARAFQGQLVEDEGSSTQKGAPGSRIIDFRVSDETLGGCNQCAKGCAFNKPVACYTCFRFEPFLDAPHEEVLERLLKDRDKAAKDPRMAAINDESIRAVEEVIALCVQVHRQRMTDAGVAE
jgi:integrase